MCAWDLSYERGGAGEDETHKADTYAKIRSTDTGIYLKNAYSGLYEKIFT